MPIVGTAGHVDHGKSTLVEALTGRDPDRWDEEKDRGLTIDLGFAWTELRPGLTAGFVDVPGHERFIKNMLAGVGALDVALFVVAADELWMPQTEEHLVVLDLLDVRHGVIALTRADLADADTIELGQLEIQDRVASTTLEEWPIAVVSAVTGLGMEQLRTALADALDRAGAAFDIGRPRLWVDRSFLIAGAGVVVTGTLTGGEIRRGDMLDLFPGGRAVRVRGLQSHERDVEVAEPGTRTAINLAGIERTEIARGALVAGREQARITGEFLVDLRTVRGYDEDLTSRGAFHLHVGSGVWPMQLQPLAGEAITGSGAALISVDESLPVQMGDRFIVREVGRRAVVAGGRVIDSAPRGRLASLVVTTPGLRGVLDDSADDRAQALLDARGVASVHDLEIDSGGGRPVRGVFAGDSVASEAEATTLIKAVERDIRVYQKANPLRPGAPKASLATGLRVPGDLLDAVIAISDRLVDGGVSARTADFSGALSVANDAAWQAARESLGAGLAVPRANQLGLDQELLHALARSGRLVRIADDLVYLPEQIEQVTDLLPSLGGEFTVAAFRDALAVSRRHAVPLLEWLDAQGWTVRRGDARSIRTPPDR